MCTLGHAHTSYAYLNSQNECMTTESSITSVEDSSSLSIDPDTFLGPEVSMPVGDNIDKEVKLRDMRSDYQALSLHYFHL